MGNFGHVHKVTAEVGGKLCTFRSKLEYRYAVYLQLLKEQGHIKDWVHEPQDMVLEFEHGRYGNTRKYLPDFAVLNNEDEWEIHETKGWFPPIDYTKMKKCSEAWDNLITVIFANLTDCKSLRAQYTRAKRLEPHVHRIIYDANKSIFKSIQHLFDF